MGLRLASDNDVHLKEGVEDVDFAGGKVGLTEGVNFDNLGHVSSLCEILGPPLQCIGSRRTCLGSAASEQNSLPQYLS